MTVRWQNRARARGRSHFNSITSINYLRLRLLNCLNDYRLYHISFHVSIHNCQSYRCARLLADQRCKMLRYNLVLTSLANIIMHISHASSPAVTRSSVSNAFIDIWRTIYSSVIEQSNNSAFESIEQQIPISICCAHSICYLFLWTLLWLF